MLDLSVYKNRVILRIQSSGESTDDHRGNIRCRIPNPTEVDNDEVTVESVMHMANPPCCLGVEQSGEVDK